MEIAVKVGHKFGPKDDRHIKGLRDGNILAIRPDGFFTGALERKHHCILTTQHDYWDLRGTHDHKSHNQKVLDLKKFTTSRLSNGLYSWDYSLKGLEEPEEEKIRPVDSLVDFKFLLDANIITLSQFDAIYDKSRDPGIIYVDRALDDYIFDEDVHVRQVSRYSKNKGSVTAGTYYVGSSGADYTTWKLAIDNIANLTGDISILGKTAEEMAENDLITFDVNTGAHTTIFGVASGQKHDGGVYGSGHRINWGFEDAFLFDEVNNGDVNKVTVQDLAFDGAGTYRYSIYCYDGFNTTPLVVQRCLMKGGTNSRYLVQCTTNGKRAIIRNNITYDCDCGVYLDNTWAFTQWEIYNNTFIDGTYGIRITYDPGSAGNLLCKNNICVNNATADFLNTGAIDTHSKNVSSDATSPDVAYRSKDIITNSVFKDYAGNDFRLDSGGDATNLAILDDGDDLSGIGSPAQFSDDIEDQARSTWYIGASEIVAAGGLSIPVAMSHYLRQMGA